MFYLHKQFKLCTNNIQGFLFCPVIIYSTINFVGQIFHKSLPGLLSLIKAADPDLLGVESRVTLTLGTTFDADDADVRLPTGGGSKRSYFNTRLQER